MSEGQDIEANVSPKDVVTSCLESGNAIEDDGKKTWNKVVDQIISKDGRIIALRGAGSINGADPEESRRMLQEELIPLIEQLLAAGEQVTFLFDGDSDSPDKPDIGYFAGRLLDKFGNSQDKVLFVAAQKRSWYYPPKEGGNLTNANGADYLTYVFEDGRYPGDHNAFTQDTRLVSSGKYEQWYIGASGDIATSQLSDFNDKVPQGEKRSATLFRVHNNSALDSEINSKLEVAQAANDVAKVDKFTKQLAQRQNIYGSHWGNGGDSTLSVDKFPNLDISLVSK